MQHPHLNREFRKRKPKQREKRNHTSNTTTSVGNIDKFFCFPLLNSFKLASSHWCFDLVSIRNMRWNIEGRLNVRHPHSHKIKVELHTETETVTETDTLTFTFNDTRWIPTLIGQIHSNGEDEIVIFVINPTGWMERQGKELNNTKISPTTATTLCFRRKNPPNHHSRTHRPFRFFGFPNFTLVLSVLEFSPFFCFPRAKIHPFPFEFRTIFPVFVCFWIDKQCSVLFFFWFLLLFC